MAAEFHPPEGLLREIALKMCSAEPGTSTEVAGTKVVHGFHGSDKPCQWCLFDAERALAALFEACEVRERWGVRWIWGDGHRAVGWYRDRAVAETERDLPHRASVAELVRRCDLETPLEPVPDPPVREEKSSG